MKRTIQVHKIRSAASSPHGPVYDPLDARCSSEPSCEFSECGDDPELFQLLLAAAPGTVVVLPNRLSYRVLARELDISHDEENEGKLVALLKVYAVQYTSVAQVPADAMPPAPPNRPRIIAP